MLRDKSIVPALMFHSVGLERHPWTWSYISESLESFEAKIKSIKDAGYTAVFWQDVYDHMAGSKTLPDNSILLTFDDGYLDNWVYVFPILKKYRMKGTIFVSPDFVDPTSAPRPNLDDVTANRLSQDELDVAGFLSWQEMRGMEHSGIIDIQSHAMTHTWYFTGPSIVSYHSPSDTTPHPWLFWNLRPDRKPYYLTEDQQGFAPWGTPVLQHEKSLIARRFFPDEKAVEAIAGFVEENGATSFFDDTAWRSRIDAYVANVFGSNELPGTYESDEAQQQRINDEITHSKQHIERELNKKVDFICWPGGANSEVTRELALQAGYKSWTLSSRDKANTRNRPGSDPSEIKRMGTSNQLNIRGRDCGTGGQLYHSLRLSSHQQSTTHRLALKGYKMIAFARSFVAPSPE